MIVLWLTLAGASEPPPVGEEAPAPEEPLPTEPAPQPDPADGDVPEAPSEPEDGEPAPSSDAPATEEPAAPVPATAPAPVSEEITVWGEAHVREARARLIRAIEDQGWTARQRRPGGRVIFRPPSSWIGRAVLHPDGRLEFGQRALAFEFADTSPDADYPPHTRPEDGGNPTGPLDGNAPFGGSTEQGPSVSVLPAKRKQAAAQQRLLDAIHGDLDRYRQVIRNTRFQEQLQALPTRLDSLWADGTPLRSGEPVLRDEEERRRAVLAYWASRADTPEGERVCRAVEIWLRETVQTSSTPLTAEEIASVRRPDGRALDL